MIEYYTKDQFDEIATFLGDQVKSNKANSTFEEVIDSSGFIDALDNAITGGSAAGGLPGVPLKENTLVLKFKLQDTPKFLTVSRNGNAPVTANIIDDPHKLIELIYLADDKKSYNFFDPSMLGIQADLSPDNSYINTPVIGFSEDSVNIYGDIFDPRLGFYETLIKQDLDADGSPDAPEFTIPSSVKSFVNTVEILPTPGVPINEDFYYTSGASELVGSKVMVSLASAIVEKKEDVVFDCTPESAIITFNSYSDSYPEGSFHARYRINGEAWIDYYLAEADINYGPIRDFIDSIYYDGYYLVETSGHGGTSETIPTPFWSYRADSEIYSGGVGVKYVWELGDPKITTLEFMVTQSSPNDIVYLAFGKNTTLKACADCIWEGM